uniref:Taste receptor type 2 n=1 Tax=Denticeps clupeoides TaxID=299321 RepID=A0AAY4D4Z0_9TELE
MSISSIATVRYLRHHMKNMEVSGTSFSSPRIRSQMRVTITGIVQEVLYFLCSLWVTIDISFFQRKVSTFDPNSNILMTVFCLYSFGTTINLGVGHKMMTFSVGITLTSSVWLNVFYCSQIVRTRPVFWMKRNIITIVYTALFLHILHLVLDTLLDSLLSFNIISSEQGCSRTSNHTGCGNWENQTSLVTDSSELSTVSTVLWSLRIFVICLALCIMSASSFATVHYLRQHMRAMKTSSFFSPILKSQMRVTITGIIQAALYLLCSLWTIINLCLAFYSNIIFDVDQHIFITGFSLYSFATTINMSVGQSLFRQRATELWQRTKSFIGP